MDEQRAEIVTLKGIKHKTYGEYIKFRKIHPGPNSYHSYLKFIQLGGRTIQNLLGSIFLAGGVGKGDVVGK